MYKAKMDDLTKIWRVYDEIGGVVAVGHTSSQELATILNDETAALRQQIADLQAENTKLKADCASYDTVLNQVAVAFLEANEKLQQVEVQESPSFVWNMAHDDKAVATGDPVETPLEGFMHPCETCNGSGTQPHFLYDHLTTHCDDCGGTGIHTENLLFEPEDKKD